MLVRIDVSYSGDSSFIKDLEKKLEYSMSQKGFGNVATRNDRSLRSYYFDLQDPQVGIPPGSLTAIVEGLNGSTKYRLECKLVNDQSVTS